MVPFYVGDFLYGKLVRIWFNTITPATLVPIALVGGAVAITRNGVVVTPSGGVTLNVSVGSVIGLNNVTIDMSADLVTFTRGGYTCYLSAGTQAGNSMVGTVIGQWSVADRSVVVDPNAGTVSIGGPTILITSNVVGTVAPTTSVFNGATNMPAVGTPYIGNTLTFLKGPNAGLSSKISAYSAATQQITVSPAFPLAPVALASPYGGDTFQITNP